MMDSLKEGQVTAILHPPARIEKDPLAQGNGATAPDIQLVGPRINGRKPISPEFKIMLAILVPIVIVAAVYKIAFSPVNIQAINMEIAGERLPEVKAILDGDKRFKDVSAFVYTGQNGAVGLHGTVEKEEDLFLLMKAVAAVRLPVGVHWRVKLQEVELKKR